MRRFAALYRRLDRSTATLDKRAALVDYFRDAPPRDAAWALWLLTGGKVTAAVTGARDKAAKARIANTRELRVWIAQESRTPDWLVDASYDQVGDLAETLALLLDDPVQRGEDIGLADWIEGRLAPLAHADEDTRRAVVVDAWRSLAFDERLVFNKLLTGALRVGVSQGLVQQALAELSGLDIALIAQRMLGAWTPSEAFVAGLLSHEAQPGDAASPFPFFLASPLETALRAGDDGEPPSPNDPDAVARALGDIGDWQLEWKWDGIRVQLIRRNGDVALWSRGEERMDGRFPEIETALAALPRDAVIDGELLAWRESDAAPLPFTALQTRIQRRKPGPKTLADTPVRVLAYDLLELDGEDLRERPMVERRALLEGLLAATGDATESELSLPRVREPTDVAFEVDGEADYQGATATSMGPRLRGDDGVEGDDPSLSMDHPPVGLLKAASRVRVDDVVEENDPSLPRRREPMDVGLEAHGAADHEGATATSMDPRLRGDDGSIALPKTISPSQRIALSPHIHAASWSDAARLREDSRTRGVEGLMLKRADSPYRHGRKRGDWWKWKVDPLTIDAVLLYAQSGHGRRSTLYTDYTFGLWDGDALVPVAKAYSGLDDKEILQLDRWIRAHTTERFGPVRAVQPGQVFELGFEAVNRSSRHKSGIAVRFPRILRWRHDKPVAEADALYTLRALAR
jgi:ATP-dependent DNA ligase